MTGRVARARAPVDYNDKVSMEPAWIKTMKAAQSKTPPKKAKKSSETTSGSAEKENSKERKTTSKSKSMTKQPKEQEAAPSKEVASVKKTVKTKKTSKVEKTPKAGSRGRNAGVTVVPIVDKKVKTPKVPGLRKLQVDEEPAPKPAALPKPPAESKEVPGLPGIVQKAAPVAQPKAVTQPRPGSAKHGAASKLPSPKAPAPSKRPASPLVQVQPTKKYRQEAPAPVAPTAAAARPRISARASVLQTLPPSPEPLCLSPLPANDIADKLDEMRSNFANMAELCTKLQQENAEFKSARICEDVEGVIAEQTNAVMNHGRKASELAQHWKEEADRMAELVEQLRGGILQEELRTTNAELAAARQTILDKDIAAAQREKAVVELQTRNKFLERHARIPVTQDKCVGTDPPVGVNTWVQVPHGIELNQARAFVPEGAAGSSLYTAGGGAGMGRAPGGVVPVYVDASYTLAQQRTNAYAQTGSDMQLASRRPAPDPGFPGTFESVQQRNRGVGTRRMSAPSAPLIGPDGLPRQIQFYSKENSGGGLQAVPEEPHHEAQDEQQQAMPGSGMLPPGEAELLATCGMIVSALPGSRLLYTHPLTGYRFELGPAPMDSDDAEADSVVYDVLYRPIAFGTAQGYIQEIPSFGEVLMGDFSLATANRYGLVEMICQGLQVAHRQ